MTDISHIVNNKTVYNKTALGYHIISSTCSLKVLARVVSGAVTGSIQSKNYSGYVIRIPYTFSELFAFGINNKQTHIDQNKNLFNSLRPSDAYMRQ